MNVTIDLTTLKVDIDETHKSIIPLFDNIGIKMKYPGLSLFDKMKKLEGNEVDMIFDVIIECIDSIYDEETSYPAHEQSREDLETFINNLTQDQFQKVQKFFETMPKLEKQIEFDCPMCKYHHQHTIRGLSGFF